jgi:hypothetical protein
MRKISTLILCLFAITAFSQNKVTVKLNWKIGKNDTLSYKTIIDETLDESSKNEFDSLMKSLFTDSLSMQFLTVQQQIINSSQNSVFRSNLTSKGNGVVDIVIMPMPKEEMEKTVPDSMTMLIDLMKTMNSGPIVSGSVNATGGIQSFWVNNVQKNILALLFELPTKSVKIGDTWSIDFNYFQNNPSFKCDSSFKTNKVTLKEIKKINGENIAILKYEIIEFVQGLDDLTSIDRSNDTPSFKLIPTKTTMKCSYEAVGEFSIDHGNWVSYKGTLRCEGQGQNNMTTKYTLIKN